VKRYTGIPCVHCQEKFEDRDDVVVCPICGAPHHRHCYQELGQCALEEKHASGEIWHPPGSAAASGRGEQAVCPNCRAPNPRTSQYCQMCGTKLHTSHQERRDPPPAAEGAFTPPPGKVYTGNVDNTDQWEIQGVTAREISTYIGNNSHYFLRQFRSLGMNAGGWSWNWPAFFFGPFYLLYRKLYLLGVCALVIHILCHIPLGILMFEVFKTEAPALGGIALPINQELVNLMGHLSRIGQAISYTLMGIQALFTNRFFLQKVLADIQRIRQQMPPSSGSREYFTRLYFAGRPNRLIVISTSFLIFSLMSIYLRFIQDTLQIPLVFIQLFWPF
jgi:hypothetical protein